MKTVRDVQADKLIASLAEEFKKNENIKPHKYALFVKSGVNADRPPFQEDFWYLRTAAILRKIYLRGRPVGVERLRTAFGGRKRRGHKPAHQRKTGGKFIRLMLQQLEKSGYIAKSDTARKGRILAPAGQKLLDKLTKNL